MMDTATSSSLAGQCGLVRIGRSISSSLMKRRGEGRHNKTSQIQLNVAMSWPTHRFCSEAGIHVNVVTRKLQITGKLN